MSTIQNSPAAKALALALFSFPVLADGNNTDIVMEHVYVTATRSEAIDLETAAAISMQNMESVRNQGFTYGTDEFRGVTGVFFRRGESGGDEFPFVSFRGSTGTEGSLSLIDGIPLIGVYDELQLNEIPYDAISNVEVVKGPVSALYGRGALYGVTNYRTMAADEDVTKMKLTAGEDGFYRASLTAERQFDNAGLVFAVARENYDGWRDNGGKEISNVFAKLDYELNADTDVSAYLNFNDRTSELTNGRILGTNGEILPFTGGDEGFIGYGQPDNDMQNLMAAVRVRHQLADDLRGELTLSYRTIDRDTVLNFFDPFGTFLFDNIVSFNGFKNDTEHNVFFVEGVINWSNDVHNLLVGASFERGTSEEKNSWSGQNGFTFECGFAFYSVQVDISSGQILNLDHPCFEQDTLLADNEFDNEFWGIFVQDEILLSEQWRLTLGLRYDDFSREATFSPIDNITFGGSQSGDADAWSPKASLSYLSDWGQIYASYGRGFNSNFGATFEWDPTQYLRPETRPTEVDSFEIGVKAKLNDNVRIDLALFSSEQTNRRQIVANPAAANDFTQPFNLVAYGDKYESQGAELAINAQLGDNTSINLGYTYIDAEWQDYSVAGTDFSGNQPVGVPENMLFMQLSHQFTHWLAVNAQFESYDDYHYTVDNRFEDGGYELVSLHAQIAPDSWQGWALDVSVSNLLDEDYYFFFGRQSSPTYAMPGEPRQLRISISADF